MLKSMRPHSCAWLCFHGDGVRDGVGVAPGRTDDLDKCLVLCNCVSGLGPGGHIQ